MIPFNPYFLQPFFAFFGAIDPIGNVPLFLSLTKKLTSEQRNRIAFSAVIRASAILLAFTLAGSVLLSIFHLSIEGFRIAGGIVFTVMGLQIIFDINFSGKSEEEMSKCDVSMVPLATPLLAGPGTISMTIILVQQYGYLLTIVSGAVSMLLTWVIFRFASKLLKALGDEGTKAFGKIIGVIIVAIGVEMIRSGFIK